VSQSLRLFVGLATRIVRDVEAVESRIRPHDEACDEYAKALVDAICVRLSHLNPEDTEPAQESGAR